MSIQVLYQADILLDGVACSTEFSRLKLSLNQAVKEKTAFQDAARSYVPSIYAASVDGEFYYQTGNLGNLTANKMEGITVGPSASGFVPTILTLAPDLGVGSLAYIWKAASAKNEIGAEHGEINKGEIGFQASYRNVQATRLLRAANAIVGTSGLGTALNLGALTAAQILYAALHVIGTTGGAAGTSFTIISSATSSLTAPTTRVTFAVGTSGFGADWQEAAGAIADTWWAAKWTGYTGTGATVSISAGIQ